MNGAKFGVGRLLAVASLRISSPFSFPTWLGLSYFLVWVIGRLFEHACPLPGRADESELFRRY